MTIHEPSFEKNATGDWRSPLLGYLDRHGAGLTAVIEAIDEVFVTDEVQQVLMLAEEPAPDVEAIREGLLIALEALEWVSFDRLHRNSASYHGPDLVSAARWHGARLSDLLA